MTPGLNMRAYLQKARAILRSLEVEDEGRPAANRDVGRPVDRDARLAREGRLDPQDVGAEIGKQHRRERCRPDTGKLDSAKAVQRTGHEFLQWIAG
jgi:hypothetical protein